MQETDLEVALLMDELELEVMELLDLMIREGIAKAVIGEGGEIRYEICSEKEND